MGNLGWVGDYRLHCFPISQSKNRSEHGFHIHIMKKGKTFVKIDLETNEIIGPVDNGMTKSELRAILNFVEQHSNELKQKANNIRNK